MKLNHLDLQVSDVQAAAAFFEDHFGLRRVFSRGDEIALLEDDEGFAFGVSNLFQSPPPAYPSDFHLGFILDSAAEVESLYDRLLAQKIAIKHPLTTGGPNLYFVCLAPDNIPVEVRARANAGK